MGNPNPGFTTPMPTPAATANPYASLPSLPGSMPSAPGSALELHQVKGPMRDVPVAGKS